MSEDDIQRAIQRHVQRYDAMAQKLAEKGVSLTEPLAVEHHFWSRSRRGANLLCEHLRRLGYYGVTATRELANPTGDTWSVEAAFDRSPKEAGSKGVVETLVRTASKYESEYDGWGTSV